jgi:phenylacetate-CoA ligase
VVREFPEVVEFQVEVSREREMTELKLVIEPLPSCPSPEALAARVAETLHQRLLLRVPCEATPAGSLPRFEMKARRVVYR